MTWFANVGLCDHHHPLVVPSRWKLVMSLQKRLLWSFPLGPRNKSKNLLLFRGQVVLVTGSTGACFRTGFKCLSNRFFETPTSNFAKWMKIFGTGFCPHRCFPFPPNRSCKPSYLPFTLPFVSGKVSSVGR